MKTAFLVLLLAGSVLVPAVEAVIFTPPVTSRCFSQVDRLIEDGGATVCVDWGGEGCAVLLSQETVYGREDRCLARWPSLP